MQQAQLIKKRIASIDVLRGIVMVIMALDHTRDFFHASIIDPLDIKQTTPVLFFTRWITHYCAPTFVFLSGLSIYLQAQRKSPGALGKFLFTRGLWLIVAEVLLVSLGITFNPFYNLFILQVIWAIGISMVLMALITRLPYKLILSLGLLIVFSHNLLDYFESQPGFKAGFWWDLLHSGRFATYPVFQQHFIAIMYPFLPWLGLMLLGFCTGKLFAPAIAPVKRQRTLRLLGLGAIALFIVLRWLNVYGDPFKWQIQQQGWRTILSFLNVFKYPPSLLYMCATIGPAIILLSALENVNTRFTRWMEVYGRTAFFYYLLHFYLLHSILAVVFFAEGHTMDEAIVAVEKSLIMFQLPGSGFNLAVVYGIWLLVVIALYPLCVKYNRYKTAHPEKWWLSYL